MDMACRSISNDGALNATTMIGQDDAELQQGEYGWPGSAGLERSIWATLLMAVLGDSDPMLFYNESFVAILCFMLITLIINIIMYVGVRLKIISNLLAMHD